MAKTFFIEHRTEIGAFGSGDVGVRFDQFKADLVDGASQYGKIADETRAEFAQLTAEEVAQAHKDFTDMVTGNYQDGKAWDYIGE